MSKIIRGLLLGAGLAAAVPAVLLLAPDRGVRAADHLDPPARTDPAVDMTPDKAADITDIYAWHTASDLIIAFNFAGPQAITLPAVYDRNVLYTLNVSTDGSLTAPAFPIRFRFGTDPAGNVGIRLENVPGVGTIEGPVETTLSRNGVLIRAGLYDDPFFFDLQGFKTTQSTGTLSFDKNRNFFAGQNLTAVVFQIPRTALGAGVQKIRIWADTSRFGGQL
ncbi:MAG: hypothetical protein JWM38_969 [Sphingomonas bacterium]|nr:hypothetical protein [Sphingomonas bacterium]MDB5717542.1 hypothetical protein [Sphingomonas bacterium]